MKSTSKRTTANLPRDLHRRQDKATVCVGRGNRRLSLDPPLIRPAGRRIRIDNEEVYRLIDFP